MTRDLEAENRSDGRLVATCDLCHQPSTRWKLQTDALEAENRRLREAIKRALDWRWDMPVSVAASLHAALTEPASGEATVHHHPDNDQSNPHVQTIVRAAVKRFAPPPPTQGAEERARDIFEQWTQSVSSDPAHYIGMIATALRQAHAEENEAAAAIAIDGCLVPPDGGSPTEDERLMCENIATAIRARLKEPGK